MRSMHERVAGAFVITSFGNQIRKQVTCIWNDTWVFIFSHHNIIFIFEWNIPLIISQNCAPNEMPNMSKGATGSQSQRLQFIGFCSWFMNGQCSAGCHGNILMECSFCCWLLVQQKDICVENMHLKMLMSAFFGPLCTGFSITKLQLLRIYLNTCWDYYSVSMHTTCATTPTHTRIHYCWQ